MTARFCASCGNPIQPDFRLCPYCGASINASTGSAGEPNARVPLTRTRIATFVGLAAVILSFTIYVVIVDEDLTALLVGLLIVSILYLLVIASRPRRTNPPDRRLP